MSDIYLPKCWVDLSSKSGPPGSTNPSTNNNNEFQIKGDRCFLFKLVKKKTTFILELKQKVNSIIGQINVTLDLEFVGRLSQNLAWRFVQGLFSTIPPLQS